MRITDENQYFLRVKSMYYNRYLIKKLEQHPLTNNARNALDNDVILHYRTFKQTWSNTGTVWAHPNSGCVVGSGFTTAKVAVFYGKRGAAVVFVGSEMVYVFQRPNENFKYDVHNADITYIAYAKERYEN